MRSAVLAVLLVAACAQAQPIVTESAATPAPDTIRYVALGDSYTIGTGVPENERFPNQLVERLADEGVPIELVANLGVNGHSSADLIADAMGVVADLRPDFVTVLIGVNDVVGGVRTDVYRANVGQILNDLLADVGRERVLVVSTPDYTRTPRGADFGNPEQQRAGIATFNSIMADEARARGITFVDISRVADEAGADPSLVARDLLHPSGVQYGRWVDLIAPAAVALLQEQ